MKSRWTQASEQCQSSKGTQTQRSGGGITHFFIRDRFRNKRPARFGPRSRSDRDEVLRRYLVKLATLFFCGRDPRPFSFLRILLLPHRSAGLERTLENRTVGMQRHCIFKGHHTIPNHTTPYHAIHGALVGPPPWPL